MSIGLVAALPVEIRCLTRQGIKFNIPFRINNTLTIIISGIGARHAEKAAELLLYENINGLLSWGTAAGLVNKLHSGDLLLPEQILDSKGNRYNADNNLINEIKKLLENTDIRIHNGVLVETTSILKSPEQKTGLAATTGAIAADMETAAIMRVAKRNHLPCGVIRTIVDEAQDILPSEIIRHTDVFGKPDIMKIVNEIFFKPSLIPRLYHLAGAMHAATGTLDKIAHQTSDLSLQSA